MKTSELRQGNIVDYECTYHKITMIFKQSVQSYWIGAKEHYINNNYTCSIDSIKPIPLTEELLLKCGFKRDSDLKNSLCKFGIWFNVKNMEATYLSQKLIKINYLHQLQNLYWCLTGEELEINM